MKKRRNEKKELDVKTKVFSIANGAIVFNV